MNNQRMPQISLLDLYNASMNHNDMQSDPEQLNTIGNFQRLFDEIAGAKAPRNQWVFQSVFRRKSKFIRGIYIWGGVGRGKTYLMDLFFQSAPTSAKKRIHFHRFMQSIHHELKERQNTRDPLAKSVEILQNNTGCFASMNFRTGYRRRCHSNGSIEIAD